MTINTDACHAYMGLALEQAEMALNLEEIPIGAVVVSASGQVIGAGHNLRHTTADPTAHAEVVALRRAGEAVGDWRLDDCDIYVTVEPCPMCAGAIVNARIRQLIFGVRDPKAGAAVSLMSLTSDVRLNHQVGVVEGIRAEECAAILKEFFRRLRTGG